MDDMFDVFFVVIGINIGSCYIYMINGEIIIVNYGVFVFLFGQLIVDGDVQVVIIDCDDFICGLVFVLEVFEFCLVVEECEILLGIM